MTSRPRLRQSTPPPKPLQAHLLNRRLTPHLPLHHLAGKLQPLLQHPQPLITLLPPPYDSNIACRRYPQMFLLGNDLHFSGEMRNVAAQRRVRRHLLRGIGRRRGEMLTVVRRPETRTAKVVAAARYRHERAVRKVGEDRGPGREFVGVVGHDEGSSGEEAVVPRWYVIRCFFGDTLLEHLWDEQHFFDVLLEWLIECIPGFAAARVEAPAFPALLVEDVD